MISTSSWADYVLGGPTKDSLSVAIQQKVTFESMDQLRFMASENKPLNPHTQSVPSVQ